MTEKKTKKPTVKPTVEDTKALLKELRQRREHLGHALKTEMEKLDTERGEEQRLMSAARANAIKPHEEQKREEYARAQVIFDRAKGEANAVYNEVVRKARLEFDKAVKYAEAQKKVTQEAARDAFNKEANALFDDHKAEQMEIDEKFTVKYAEAQETFDSEKTRLDAKIEETEKAVEALEKRAKKPSRKDSAKPSDPPSAETTEE